MIIIKSLLSLRKTLMLIGLMVFQIIAQQSGTIEGKVTDKATKQPIPSVNIVVLKTNYGASTDLTGNFKLTNLPVGRYAVRVSSIGYETITYPDLFLSTGHSVYLEIELSESVIPLNKEIIIKGEFYRTDHALLTSTHTLSFEEIRRHPGGAEDISRVLLSLPGVLTSSDDRNDLLVRGGNPTENLNLIDNIEIPNINHFGTQGASGGPIGMINNNFVREVNFSSGGFPVKYGERLSSVLDIKLKEGNRDQFQGSVIMNIAGFGLQGEGPFTNKGSWMFSARKSYLEIIRKLNSTNVNVVPNYINYQSKIVYDFSPSNQLSFILLGGLDKVFFDENEYNYDSFFKDYKISNDQKQYAAGFNLRTLWSKQSYSIITLSSSYNNFYTDVVNANNALVFYNNKSIEREIHIKGEYNFKISPSFEISAGLGYKAVNFNHGIDYVGDTTYTVLNGIVDTVISNPLNTFTSVHTSKKFAYFQTTKWFFDNVKLVTGIRWDNFNYIKNSDVLSYRAGISYYFTPITNLNIFYGINFQTPPYVWLTTDVTSKNLNNMKAQHIVAGVEHLFSEDIKVTIEAYRKNYSDIPVSKDVPQFIASNGGAEYGAFIMRKLSSSGYGYSQGLELTVQKKLLNSFYGIISYGYSKTRFTALDKIERPGSFDYRHVFTFAAGFVPDKNYEISIKWRFTGGRPYTPFDPVLSSIIHRGVEDFNQLNSLRYPPYHRLDIRIDYRWHFNKWNLVTYIDLENAYLRLNVYQYQWDIRANKQSEVYQWRFFPVAGLNLEF